MKYHVYAIHPVWVSEEDKINYYIGLTDNVERRWKAHDRHSRNGTRDQYLYQCMREQMTMVTIIKSFNSLDDASEYEKELRPSINMGWNMRGGGLSDVASVEPISYKGVTYKSYYDMSEKLGVDYATAKKMYEGKEVFITRLRDREHSDVLKPTTLTDPDTGEVFNFDSVQSAWEWLGKSGKTNGNIAKQKAKGRPAYGYYWDYD